MLREAGLLEPEDVASFLVYSGFSAPSLVLPNAEVTLETLDTKGMEHAIKSISRMDGESRAVVEPLLTELHALTIRPFQNITVLDLAKATPEDINHAFLAAIKRDTILDQVGRPLREGGPENEESKEAALRLYLPVDAPQILPSRSHHGCPHHCRGRDLLSAGHLLGGLLCDEPLHRGHREAV